VEKFIEIVSQRQAGWITRILRNTFLLIVAFLAFGGCETLEGRKAKEYQTVLRKPVDSEEKQFEDERLRIHFSPSHKLISFTLHNKAQVPIKIIWDEVLFINPEGETRWVLNSHVEYPVRIKTADYVHHHIDSTIVAPGQSYSDYVRPFPKGLEEELIYPFKDAQYARFKLIMPVEIEGQVTVYTFAFEVVETPAAH
jgi:hypothetical protein